MEPTEPHGLRTEGVVSLKEIQGHGKKGCNEFLAGKLVSVFVYGKWECIGPHPVCLIYSNMKCHNFYLMYSVFMVLIFFKVEIFIQSFISYYQP